MVQLPPPWSMNLEIDNEMEEKLPSRNWIEMVPTGEVFFKLEIFYYGDLVFSLDTHKKAEPKIFIRMIENENPLQHLLKMANDI